MKPRSATHTALGQPRFLHSQMRQKYFTGLHTHFACTTPRNAHSTSLPSSTVHAGSASLLTLYQRLLNGFQRSLCILCISGSTLASPTLQFAVPLRRPLSLQPYNILISTHGDVRGRVIDVLASRAGAAVAIPRGRPTTIHPPKTEVSQVDSGEMRRRLCSCCTCAITCGGRARR